MGSLTGAANPFGQVSSATTPDARTLHYIAKDRGSDITVAFESGLGCAHGLWALVQPDIARFANTVVYDRAGYGCSEADSAPRTVARLTDDLEVILDAASVWGARKFVIVGHSLGGLVAQYAAARRPECVAGLVLVDSIALDVPQLHGLWYRTSLKAIDLSMRIAARVGLLQQVGGRFIDRISPPGFADDIKGCEFTRAGGQARKREARGWLTTLDHDGVAAVSLPDLPAVVMSSTRVPKPMAKIQAALIASHRSLADALPRGSHVILDCGHNIHLDEPSAVTAAVQQVVESCM
ncbi:hypothetical protein A5733_06870 [Mycobacterium sp. NS-7484]|uniref:alpha/beta fold hydrolase n=1 Tax=unclassified Mycobacterium TaxID=2642494 RepID=UPI0007FE4462|nr:MULTISPECIES: alpha/beta hydrolase [unclassified Mycobacterium]OBG89014.1 hypothetical protein A5699_15545 [Mycobacterium sp. E802]OMB98938.1 hypothetical protein A5733_06870 [Mycobacterium sp. NS-7484]